MWKLQPPVPQSVTEEALKEFTKGILWMLLHLTCPWEDEFGYRQVQREDHGEACGEDS